MSQTKNIREDRISEVNVNDLNRKIGVKIPNIRAKEIVYESIFILIS